MEIAARNYLGGARQSLENARQFLTNTLPPWQELLTVGGTSFIIIGNYGIDNTVSKVDKLVPCVIYFMGLIMAGTGAASLLYRDGTFCFNELLLYANNVEASDTGWEHLQDDSQSDVVEVTNDDEVTLSENQSSESDENAIVINFERS